MAQLNVVRRTEPAGLLPINVMYDSGLTHFERRCVGEAMREFNKWFPDRTVYDFGSSVWSAGDYSSADWYIQKAKMHLGRHGEVQLDANSLIYLMVSEPWQKQCHIDVLFTSRDLTAEGLNFCFGMTMGRYTVQSVYRYRGLNPFDQKLAIKAVVWHELGHVLGAAADLGRMNTEDKLGAHCTNHGCVMRQGMDVDEWVRHAKDASRGRTPFCTQCLQDMRKSRI